VSFGIFFRLLFEIGHPLRVEFLLKTDGGFDFSLFNPFFWDLIFALLYVVQGIFIVSLIWVSLIFCDFTSHFPDFFEIGHPIFSFWFTLFLKPDKVFRVSRASRTQISRSESHIPTRSRLDNEAGKILRSDTLLFQIICLDCLKQNIAQQESKI